MAKKNKNNNISTGELSAQSLDFLNLSKQPFANEILSDKSFFKTQSLTKIIDSLTHQVQFSDLLLLVEGVHGSGKTCLFRQFIQNDIANTKSLSMQAEATDTLVQIQQKMSIHLQDLGDAGHLDENLKSLQMFDQTPLIIMDNSHVLSDTTIQELFRYQQQLQQEHEVTLKILMFANSGMSDTLQKITDIQADQIYVQNMPELSPKQLDNFITHRLRNAGYSGEPLLKSSDIQQLLKKCNGSPLEIMNQAAPIIDKIINNKLNPPTPAWVKTLIITGLLLIVVAGAYLYFLFDTTDKQPSEDNTPTVTTQTEETDDETTDVIDILESDSIPADTGETDAIQPRNASVTEPAVSEKNESNFTKPNTPEENTPKENTLEQNTHATSASDPRIIKRDSIENNTIEADTTEVASAEKLLTKEKPVPIEVPQTQTINTPNVKPETLQKTAPVKNISETEIVAPSKTALPVNPVLLELDKMGLHDASWLSQQSSKNWTLQLLGARDPETLLKFAQRNNLSNNAAWYKTWLTSKPYYVLVYGSYNSRETARSTITGLPPQLRSLKPWVKSMKSVQQAL